MLEQPAFLFAPHLTDLHFFVRTPFSGDHHIDFSPATDATRGAASASPTCSMRSVAAPRLIMPSFVIPVEYEDPAGCRAENPQAPRRRRDEPLSEYFSVLRSRS